MGVWVRIGWFLLGALAVMSALFARVGAETWALMSWPPTGDGNRVGPVAISPQWSVVLEEKGTHPFLAEYDYRLRVFSSGTREGEYHGVVDLIPNGGGRTWLCLYLLTAANLPTLLEVDDRMETSIVDLQGLQQLPHVPNGYARRFVGAFVEESIPLRFVSSLIEPTCPPDR
jgi:hypothetical protein